MFLRFKIKSIVKNTILAFLLVSTAGYADTYIELNLIAGYDKASAAQLHGDTHTPSQKLSVFSDTDNKADSSSVHDIAGGAKLNIGKRFSEWQAELQYHYTYRFDLNGYFIVNNRERLFETEIQLESIMLRLGRNFKWSEHRDISLMLGVGRSYFNTETRDWRDWSLTQDKNNDLAWQVSLALISKITLNWHYKLGYQYSDFGKFSANLDENNTHTISSQYRSHGLILGIGYSF